MSLGDFFHNRRIYQKEMTLRDFALTYHFDVIWLSNFERGRLLATEAEIRRLCGIFEVDYTMTVLFNPQALDTTPDQFEEFIAKSKNESK